MDVKRSEQRAAINAVKKAEREARKAAEAERSAPQSPAVSLQERGAPEPLEPLQALSEGADVHSVHS